MEFFGQSIAGEDPDDNEMINSIGARVKTQVIESEGMTQVISVGSPTDVYQVRPTLI